MKLENIMSAALAAVAVCAAHAAQNDINAIKPSFPFKIDADLVEQAYVGAEWSAPFRVMDPESKEVNGLYLVPDKKFTGCNTKVCFFVDPSNITGSVIAPYPADVPPGADEKIEFHFRPKGDVVFCVAVNMSEKATTSAYHTDTLKERVWAPRDIKAAVDVGKHSVLVEFSIPRASFGAGASAAVWRCNVIRRGASCGGLSSLAPTNRELPAPEKFVRLKLGHVESEKPIPPLEENISKKTFLWGDAIWDDTLPEVAPPVHMKELEKIAFSGYRGSRAVCSFRVSNLADSPALYNLNVISGSDGLVKNLRLREVGYLELRGGERIPDPIFELPIGGVLRIAPRSTAIVWADVDCTHLQPGKHLAKILLHPGYSGFEKKRVTLQLTVEEPDLREIDMPVFFYAQSHRTQAVPISAEYDFNVLTIAPHVHYPPADANGNIDFSELDAKLAAFEAGGLPKRKMRIMLYSMFPNWAGFKTHDGRKLKFLEPEWKVEYGKRIKAVVKHLREKHGIGYDRMMLSTLDEPKGDPSDPKTKAWAAIEGAKYIRSVDPKLRLFCNPWANEPEYLQQYLDLYDVLEPYLRRMLNGTEDPDIAKRYRESGKEIWSYTIYVKQNTVHQYRRVFWGNAANGFDGSASVYGLTACTGDPFDSYDTNAKGTNVSDYNCAFRNPRTGQVAPSRRLEAWYQGLVDFKLLKWCRMRLAERESRGEDVSKIKAKLERLIRDADVPRGDFEKIRVRLVNIARTLAP
ncbi:MAG: hypothetical protein E7046_06315 [Lentisphaerae bacterium]|nr:hypothetical protein [Lentisphaerota bacterium]